MSTDSNWKNSGFTRIQQDVVRPVSDWMRMQNQLGVRSFSPPPGLLEPHHWWDPDERRKRCQTQLDLDVRTVAATAFRWIARNLEKSNRKKSEAGLPTVDLKEDELVQELCRKKEPASAHVAERILRESLLLTGARTGRSRGRANLSGRPLCGINNWYIQTQYATVIREKRSNPDDNRPPAPELSGWSPSQIEEAGSRLLSLLVLSNPMATLCALCVARSPKNTPAIRDPELRKLFPPEVIDINGHVPGGTKRLKHLRFGEHAKDGGITGEPAHRLAAIEDEITAIACLAEELQEHDNVDDDGSFPALLLRWAYDCIGDPERFSRPEVLREFLRDFVELPPSDLMRFPVISKAAAAISHQLKAKPGNDDILISGWQALHEHLPALVVFDTEDQDRRVPFGAGRGSKGEKQIAAVLDLFPMPKSKSRTKPVRTVNEVLSLLLEMPTVDELRAAEDTLRSAEEKQQASQRHVLLQRQQLAFREALHTHLFLNLEGAAAGLSQTMVWKLIAGYSFDGLHADLVELLPVANRLPVGVFNRALEKVRNWQRAVELLMARNNRDLARVREMLGSSTAGFHDVSGERADDLIVAVQGSLSEELPEELFHADVLLSQSPAESSEMLETVAEALHETTMLLTFRLQGMSVLDGNWSEMFDESSKDHRAVECVTRAMLSTLLEDIFTVHVSFDGWRCPWKVDKRGIDRVWLRPWE